MQLAEREGYKTEIDRNSNPFFQPGDVAIAFSIRKPDSEAFGFDEQKIKNLSPIRDYCDSGGSAAVFELREDFPGSAKIASSQVGTVATTLGGTSTTLRINEDFQDAAASSSYLPDDLTSNTLSEGENSLGVAIDSSKRVVASVRFTNKGKYEDISDGIIATNAFIGQNDNADEAMRLIRIVAPPGSRLVFAEASFGNAVEASTLAMIGPWAVASWWQLLLLFVVIVYTLGKPFGYPDEERLVQRGARDLVDAVAVTYRRSRATQLAMRWLHLYADREVRRKLKLSSEASDQERNRRIPGSLALALSHAQTASTYPVAVSDAVHIAARLDLEVRQFVGKPPRRSTRRRGMRSQGR